MTSSMTSELDITRNIQRIARDIIHGYRVSKDGLESTVIAVWTPDRLDTFLNMLWAFHLH